MGKFLRGNIKAAVLTAELVREIRHKYHILGYTQGQLAREYQINVNTVGRIVRGETWQDVPLAPAPEPSAAEVSASMTEVLRRLNETAEADPAIRAEHDLKILKGDSNV